MPIKTKKLMGIIVSKGLTQKEVAHKLGIAPNTFYSKMAKGVFGSDEIEKMIELLDIDNPVTVFRYEGFQIVKIETTF